MTKSRNRDHEMLQYAFSLHQAGNLNGAADIYRQLIKNAKNFYAFHYLGVIETSYGNYEKAEKLMAHSMAIQPPNIQFIDNYAAVLCKLGNFEAALKFCEQGIKIQRANVDLIYISAVALFKMNRLQESLARFDKIISLQPRHIAAINERGSVLAEMRRFDAAIACFKEALALDPKYTDAFLNTGKVLNDLGRYSEALAAYDDALKLKPDLVGAWHGRGNICFALKRHDEALAAYDNALKLKPDLVGAWHGRGNVFFTVKRYDDALTAYDRALTLQSDLAEAWLGRGDIFFELDRYDDALAAYDKALTFKQDLAEAWLGRGNIFFQLDRYDAALAAYDRALTFRPDLAKGWLGRANVFLALRRHDDALTAYDRALTSQPDLAEGWHGRGNVFFALKRHDEALAAYDKALKFKPDLVGAWHGRGNVFFALNRHDEALVAYDNALRLKPDLVGAWNGRGNVFLALRRYDDALTAYDRTLTIKPDFVEGLVGRGNVFFDLKRYDEALAAYDRALTFKPDLEYVPGSRLHMKRHMCIWQDFEVDCSRLVSDVRNGIRTVDPFTFLAVASFPADQQKCATLYVADKLAPSGNPLWHGERYAHDRIRIAYLSADFHEHATALLMAGMFEQHDKSRFEITALSFGPEQDTVIRRRLKQSFDRFLDVGSLSDEEIAEIIRTSEIDIAIDLKGFTQDARTNVLARRPAPVQVNYLGFPGTMGANYIDYLIADKIVVPSSDVDAYSEKIVYLPDSYQANDSKRRIAEKVFFRKDEGLPEHGFIFCSFNNNFKITPGIFDIWMRLLKKIEGSVIWLFEGNAMAAHNLRQEAECRGVSGGRLIFAPLIRPEEHLARHRLADLFLDTLPYGAHTTASDALWAGLPVLTCLGSTFPGRVAASLLHAIGLPELVAKSNEEYEALALNLARDPILLASIKAKLIQNRDTHPLFNTTRFTRHIEAAYITMWESYQRGEPPKSFTVDPII